VKKRRKVAARTGADTFLEILEAEQQTPTTTQHMRRVLTVGFVLAILQLATGIDVFLYYAPIIFSRATHSGSAALLQTVLLGAVNVVVTVLAMTLVDRAGRSPLALRTWIPFPFYMLVFVQLKSILFGVICQKRKSFAGRDLQLVEHEGSLNDGSSRLHEDQCIHRRWLILAA
jgi:Sugar (and other) transporter